MTAKDKAQELLDKYRPLVNNWDCYWDTRLPQETIDADAKKCALICINEILEAGRQDVVIQYFDDSFWLDVKQEIEKI